MWRIRLPGPVNLLVCLPCLSSPSFRISMMTVSSCQRHWPVQWVLQPQSVNYKLQCPIAALHSHNSNTSGTCTSWQHLTKHLQHNCIKNSKQSTVKEAIFWQVQDSTKCDVVVEAHCYLSISGELIVSRYVAGRFGHVGLCQLRTKLKKLQRETSYIAITGQWCGVIKSGCLNPLCPNDAYLRQIIESA